MNFSGWVAIPRSVLSNTHTGRLSNTEQLALLTLHLLADGKTGSGYINAAALLTFLSELKYDTSKRVLQSLEDKGFIYRQITHASKKLYPYWIHGYQISDGANRLLWTNLSQVFVSKDINAIRYEKVAPDIPPDMPRDIPPDTHLDSHLNNNRNNDREKNNDHSGFKGGESFGERNGERDGDSRSEPNGESVVSGWCADGEHVDALPLGIIFRDGAYYTEFGTKIHPEALGALLRTEGTK